MVLDGLGLIPSIPDAIVLTNPLTLDILLVAGRPDTC